MTRTVTLSPTTPLDPALRYSLRTPDPSFSPIEPQPRLAAAKPLTDLQGNPLRGDPLFYGLTNLSWA